MVENPRHKESLHSVASSSTCLNQILTRKVRGRTGNQRKPFITEASVYKVMSTGLKLCLLPQPVPNTEQKPRATGGRTENPLTPGSRQKSTASEENRSKMPLPDGEKTLLSSQTQAKKDTLMLWESRGKKTPSATVGKGERKKSWAKDPAPIPTEMYYYKGGKGYFCPRPTTNVWVFDHHREEKAGKLRKSYHWYPGM